VGAGEISGKAIHDANIVATLIEHGIELLTTENPEDFERYPGIGTVHAIQSPPMMEPSGQLDDVQR
jgi:predicted nucleic acid-binding protein